MRHALQQAPRLHTEAHVSKPAGVGSEEALNSGWPTPPGLATWS